MDERDGATTPPHHQPTLLPGCQDLPLAQMGLDTLLHDDVSVHLCVCVQDTLTYVRREGGIHRWLLNCPILDGLIQLHWCALPPETDNVHINIML